MAAFEYRQAEEIRDRFQAHGVRYLFLGKSGAILLGFPDTTQDADIFVQMIRYPRDAGRAVQELLSLTSPPSLSGFAVMSKPSSPGPSRWALNEQLAQLEQRAE